MIMLKKGLKAAAYLLVMFVLGFGIYFFILSPNPSNPYTQLKSAWKSYKLSTGDFFATQLPDENNQPQKLSQHRGKIMVVNFWATWCPTCREEMPDLSAFHKENVKNNITVLGIAVDEVALVKAYTTKTPLAFPIVASEDKGMELARDLGNDFGWLPYTIIIDRDGKVAKTIYGRIDKAILQTEINALLAKQKPQTT
jgi:thiol-disulfide isomerase/thioredoxin